MPGWLTALCGKVAAYVVSKRNDIALVVRRIRQKPLQFDEVYYWDILPDGKRDGPFCQRCHDKDGLRCRLIRCKDLNEKVVPGEWICMVCSRYAYDADYQKPPPPRKPKTWMDR